MAEKARLPYRTLLTCLDIRTIFQFQELRSQCEFGLTGMHHGHPKRCAVPKMILGRILLRVVFLELVQERQL